MIDFHSLLDSFGIDEATMQAALVGTLVFACAMLVVSAIAQARNKRKSLRAQDEFERLQNL